MRAGRTGGRPGGRRRGRHPRDAAGARPGRHPGDAAHARCGRLRRPRLALACAAAALVLIATTVAPLPAQESGAGPDATGSGAAAVLVSGPARGQGLPFLPPNMIEYQRGVYELIGPPASAPADPASTASSEGVAVEVFYTEAPVFRRGTWTETSCDGRTVHALPEAGGTLVHYTWPEARRHAFFRFRPASEANGTPPGGDGAAGDAGGPGDGGAATPGDAAGDPADAAAAPEATGAPENEGAPANAAAAAVARSECDFIDAFLERFSFFLDTTDASEAVPFPAVLLR